MTKSTPLGLKALRLAVSGAVIGLYAAKAFGLIGFDVGPQLETAGAGLGAVAAIALKVLHFA